MKSWKQITAAAKGKKGISIKSGLFDRCTSEKQKVQTMRGFHVVELVVFIKNKK